MQKVAQPNLAQRSNNSLVCDMKNEYTPRKQPRKPVYMWALEVLMEWALLPQCILKLKCEYLMIPILLSYIFELNVVFAF